MRILIAEDPARGVDDLDASIAAETWITVRYVLAETQQLI